MLLDQFATEIGAQTSPAGPVGLPIGRPDEPAKQLGPLFLWDANALIPNTEEGLLVLWHLPQGHLDL